jgi:metallo-beta-lactamase family protein
MRLHLLGATGEVTGSSSLLEVGKKKVLVDFGLFQGARFTLEKNRRLPPVDVRKIDSVVLTHAHLDHSGRLPMLARLGYKGPIYASPATIDLTRLLLGDSARIQQADAERAAKRLIRQGKIAPEPLYDEEDVTTIMSQFVPMPMHKSTQVTAGVNVVPHDAGHILGSTSLKFTLEEAGSTKIVVFSGDIGVRDTPLLQDPEPFHEAHWVIMESTYGDRDHRSMSATIEEFLGIMKRAEADKRRVLIPAFAVGRTQQLLYYISQLSEQGRFPENLPVYLDSPMARAATQLHLDHPELMDDETRQKDFCAKLDRLKKRVRIVESRAESQMLNDDWSPCVIIAGSGMCNGGRIVHHLKHSVWRHNTDVMMVGYQSEGTLGSQLVKGLRKVRILGQMVEVRAKIHTLGGFSAHAGQTELLEWLKPLVPRKPMILLNHGEDHSREALAAKIQADFGLHVTLPEPETSFDL